MNGPSKMNHTTKRERKRWKDAFFHLPSSLLTGIRKDWRARKWRMSHILHFTVQRPHRRVQTPEIAVSTLHEVGLLDGIADVVVAPLCCQMAKTQNCFRWWPNGTDDKEREKERLLSLLPPLSRTRRAGCRRNVGSSSKLSLSLFVSDGSCCCRPMQASERKERREFPRTTLRRCQITTSNILHEWSLRMCTSTCQ